MNDYIHMNSAVLLPLTLILASSEAGHSRVHQSCKNRMFCVCIIWLTERKVDHLYQCFFLSLFDSDCDAVSELEDILERGTIPTTEGVKSIGQQLLLLQDQVGHLSHRSQYHVRSKQGTYIPKEAGLPFLFTLVPLYNISDESD